MFGIMLLGAGLCFKIAAVPFHVWTPDVYEGAPTPIAAFLSTGSKAAAFAIFARIFYVGLHDFHIEWNYVLATISALSMIIGNLAAITQDNVKRMLGVLIDRARRLRAARHHLAQRARACAASSSTPSSTSSPTSASGRRCSCCGATNTPASASTTSKGSASRAPLWAFAMVIFLLSLGGIPPTAGFIGKYFLFAAAVQAGFGWLAVIAVLMSAVSMFYYLRLVVAMYLREGVRSGVRDHDAAADRGRRSASS